MYLAKKSTPFLCGCRIGAAATAGSTSFLVWSALRVKNTSPNILRQENLTGEVLGNSCINSVSLVLFKKGITG